LINHYVDHFMTADGCNVANTMVSVFFVLSGYGIAASLRKKFGGGTHSTKSKSTQSKSTQAAEQRVTWKKLFSFYKLRVAKIFPLLWIALLIQSLVMGKPFPPSAFLGYGLEGHYWFVSSILECYLLSPFLGMLLDYKKHAALVGMTVLLLFSNYLIGAYPALKPTLMSFHLTGFPYLEIYLINIYLFFCGMYFQRLQRSPLSDASRFGRSVPRRRNAVGREASSLLVSLKTLFQKVTVHHYATFWILFFAAMSYLCLERFVSSSLPFIGSVVLLAVTSLYAVRAKGAPSSLVSQALVFAGRHSLPIYLLHIPFYFFFARAGVIQVDSWPSCFISVLLLPLFLYTAIKLEQLSKVASNGLLSL